MVVDFLDPLLATEVLLLEVVDILSGFRDRRRCSDVTVSSAKEQFSVQFKIQKEIRQKGLSPRFANTKFY